jgi:hypothetical protein
MVVMMKVAVTMIVTRVMDDDEARPHDDHNGRTAGAIHPVNKMKLCALAHNSKIFATRILPIYTL